MRGGIWEGCLEVGRRKRGSEWGFGENGEWMVVIAINDLNDFGTSRLFS